MNIKDKALKKMLKDAKGIADTQQDLLDDMQLHIKYLEKISEMQSRFPESGQSRNPELLTKHMQKKWKELEKIYYDEHSPKRLILTATYRSTRYQFLLWLRGRVIPGKKVTNIDGFKNISRHGLVPAEAFDVCVMLNGKCLWSFNEYKVVGEIGEKIGLIWGGRWESKDGPHLQQPENEVA